MRHHGDTERQKTPSMNPSSTTSRSPTDDQQAINNVPEDANRATEGVVNWLDLQVEDQFRSFFSTLAKSHHNSADFLLYQNLHATCRRWRLIFPLGNVIITQSRLVNIEEAVRVLHHTNRVLMPSLSRSLSDAAAFIRILDGALSSETLHSIKLSDFTLQETSSKAISDALSKLPLLTSLTISRIRDPSGRILSFLPSNATLRKLWLEGRSAPERAPLEHVFAALTQEQPNMPLKKLTCRGLFIRSEDLIEISKGIANKYCKLERLRCRLVAVKSNGVAALAAAIAVNKSLKYLELHFDSIPTFEMSSLLNSIHTSPAAIQTFSIFNPMERHSRVQPESFFPGAVQRLLEESFSLESLDLTGNMIMNLSRVFDPLKSVSTALTRLCLRSLRVDPQAFTSLCSALRRIPTCITQLDLRGNSPGAEGIRAIAQLVAEQQPPLRSLFLSSCEIDAAGFEELAHSILKNTVLERLALDYNNGRSQGAIAMAAALRQSNSSLFFLDLSRNSIHSDATESLAQLVRSNKTLRQLKLLDNFLTPNGQREIIDALNHTLDSNLYDLELGGLNNLDPEEIRGN